MLKYISRRVLILIPVLLGVSFLVFAILAMMPADVAAVQLGVSATPEGIEKWNEEHGLNDPFLKRYFDYMGGLLTGDPGVSWSSNTPIKTEFVQRIPSTMALTVGTIVLVILLGVPVGVISAIRQYSIFDNISRLLAMLLTSLPAADAEICFGAGRSAGHRRRLLRPLYPPLDHPLHRHGGADDPHDPLHHAGGHPGGLCADRPGQGGPAGPGGDGPRAAKRPAAHHHRRGHHSGADLPGVGTYLLQGIFKYDMPVVMISVLFIAVVIGVINLLIDILYMYIDPRLRSQFVKG